MASVFEKRPGQWHAKVKDRHGLWKSVATRERTKTAAYRFAEEMERRERRIREGLESDLGSLAELAFAQLAAWWNGEFATKLKSRSFEIYIRKYAVPVLGHIPLPQLGAPQIEALLHALEHDPKHELKPKTCNDVRAALNHVFVKGRKHGKWNGPNPVEQVDRRKVAKPPPRPTLRPEEIAPFLRAADSEWRAVLAGRALDGPQKG